MHRKRWSREIANAAEKQTSARQNLRRTRGLQNVQLAGSLVEYVSKREPGRAELGAGNGQRSGQKYDQQNAVVANKEKKRRYVKEEKPRKPIWRQRRRTNGFGVRALSRMRWHTTDVRHAVRGRATTPKDLGPRRCFQKAISQERAW